jgi:hypothetical protein
MAIQNIILQDTYIPDEVILKKEPNSMWVRPGFGRMLFTDSKGELLSGQWNNNRPISFQDDWSWIEDTAEDLFIRGQNEAALIPFITTLKNKVISSLQISQNTEGGYRVSNGTEIMEHLRLILSLVVLHINPETKEWKYRKFTNINFPFTELNQLKGAFAEFFAPSDPSNTQNWSPCNKSLAVQYLEILISCLEVFQPSKAILENNIVTEDRSIAINFTTSLFNFLMRRIQIILIP